MAVPPWLIDKSALVRLASVLMPIEYLTRRSRIVLSRFRVSSLTVDKEFELRAEVTGQRVQHLDATEEVEVRGEEVTIT